MKKTWIAVVALMMILAMLCTACGGSKDDDKAQASEPAATDLPTVTAPPASGEEDTVTGLTADDNRAPEGMTREAWLATLSEDQRKAEELTGRTVEELIQVLGEPKASEYTTSCLVADGEDGILTYDGFYVSTTRFPNGVEYVMGTSN